MRNENNSTIGSVSNRASTEKTKNWAVVIDPGLQTKSIDSFHKTFADAVKHARKHSCSDVMKLVNGRLTAEY